MEVLRINVVNKINKNDETVFDTQIDKDIQRCFLPFNLMQMLVLNPKYHMKNNVINPHNFFNKLILIIGIVVFLTIYLHRVLDVTLDNNYRQYATVNFLTFASVFDTGYRCIGFIINFVTNFSHTKEHVLLVLYFQDVHRFLYDEDSLKQFIIRTWMSVAAIFSYHIFTTVFIYIMFLKPPWNVMVYIFIIVVIDSMTIYEIRVINLLTGKTVLWNVKFLELKHVCSETQSMRLLQAYKKILQCYKIFTEVHQLPVS